MMKASKNNDIAKYVKSMTKWLTRWKYTQRRTKK